MSYKIGDWIFWEWIQVLNVIPEKKNKKKTLKLNKNEKKISVLDDIFHVLIINCDI
jgi:hypothetical protein